MKSLSEKELSQALQAGLAGVLYRWGYAPLESASQPPSLPLVTLVRLSADVASMADMCTDDEFVGETTVETHVWHHTYEDARLLQDQVRALILPTGWNLQAEQDLFDGTFRAWRISAQWTAVGGLMVS